MKYTIEKITQGEDELILRYQSESPEVESIIHFMNGRQNKLLGKNGQETVLFCPDDLLYVESVDGKTFVYTETEIFRIDKTLQALGQILYDEKYFRCSKSMIVNVDRIKSLKSLSSNRIDACMVNDEHILISRTYATEFRRLLRGENG